MTSVGWDSDTVTSAGPEDWVAALSTPGPEQAEAMRRLHQLLLRAARGQVQRMPAMLGGGGPALVEELANQAADEAMMAVLAKLGTFEGRSRFTTWAYKFAILQAATDVRRRFWRDRHLPFEGLELIPDPGASCVQYVEAADLASAVRAGIAQHLSPHQRRVLLALVVDEIPVDVLADRLGTTRNALYKTVHDARKRLRAYLRATGHLVSTETEAATS